MKKILLGICGSIAAYKTPELVRQLMGYGFEVQVIMTKQAKEFVSPLVLQSLSGNPVFTELFDEHDSMKHLELSRNADLFLIAPLSANSLAKIAHGFGDDLLSATVLGAKIPIFVAPAMNTAMWNNFFVQNNLKRLETSGIEVIAPEEGELACGEYGVGRLVSLSELVFCARRAMTSPTLVGRKVLVSMGPSREFFDKVRFFSNRSSGLMGYELAIAAYLRGAEVTVFSSILGFNWPKGIHVVTFDSAQNLFDLMNQQTDDADLVLGTAAVCDVTFPQINQRKLPKDLLDGSLKTEFALDVLKNLHLKKKGALKVGFALENTRSDEISYLNAQEKLERKGLDAIILNDLASLGEENGDFSFLTRQKRYDWGVLGKKVVAEKILDEIQAIFML